jgi:hypothetical protein
MTKQIPHDLHADRGRALHGGLIRYYPCQACGLHPRFRSLPPPLNTSQRTHSSHFLRRQNTRDLRPDVPKAPDTMKICKCIGTCCFVAVRAIVLGTTGSQLAACSLPLDLSELGPSQCRTHGTSRAPRTASCVSGATCRETGVHSVGSTSASAGGAAAPTAGTPSGRFLGCHGALSMFRSSNVLRSGVQEGRRQVGKHSVLWRWHLVSLWVAARGPKQSVTVSQQKLTRFRCSGIFRSGVPKLSVEMPCPERQASGPEGFALTQQGTRFAGRRSNMLWACLS